MRLLTELKGKMLTITLNRPDRGNSLDPVTLIDLYTAIRDAQTNEKVKLIVLTGTGEKDFCTGMDVEAAKGLANEGKKNLANIGYDIAAMIYQGKTTIVAVNGRCMGMGVFFCLAADYRLCIESALFRMPEIIFGIYPGAGCIPLMTRVCGPSITKKVLIMAEPFSSLQAVQYNIVDETVPVPEFSTRVKNVIKELIQRNPALVKAIKFAANSANDVTFNEALSIEGQCFDYFTWANADDSVMILQKQFKQMLPFQGNPEQLRREFEQSQKP